MRPVSTFFNIQLSNSRVIQLQLYGHFLVHFFKLIFTHGKTSFL